MEIDKQDTLESQIKQETLESQIKHLQTKLEESELKCANIARRLDSYLIENQPKVAYFDKLVNQQLSTCLTFKEIADKLNMGESQLLDFLLDLGWIYVDGATLRTLPIGILTSSIQDEEIETIFKVQDTLENVHNVFKDILFTLRGYVTLELLKEV